MGIPKKPLSEIVAGALREDVGSGDITSRLLPARQRVVARFLAKEDLILCGTDVAREVFRQRGARFRERRRDGARIRRGSVFAVVEGPVRAVLEAERVALNFLQRLSGIAALTRRFVDLAAPVPIFDTRKTTPGLRVLERYAVRTGGGRNHRMGLYDQILIKDNHLRRLEEGGLKEALRFLPAPIEIEADSVERARRFAAWPIHILLLDNLSLSQLRRAVAAVRAVNPRIVLEASGGVRLGTVGAIARTGVDRISVGALTHSAPAVDISLEL